MPSASNASISPQVFLKRNVALLGKLFVSLEVPGQNGMVSRDGPLARQLLLASLVHPSRKQI